MQVCKSCQLPYIRDSNNADRVCSASTNGGIEHGTSSQGLPFELVSSPRGIQGKAHAIDKSPPQSQAIQCYQTDKLAASKMAAEAIKYVESLEKMPLSVDAIASGPLSTKRLLSESPRLLLWDILHIPPEMLKGVLH